MNTVRFELGSKERDIVEQVAMSKTVSNYVEAGAYAVAGIGVGLAGYAAYEWLKDHATLFEDILKQGAWVAATGPGATGGRTGPVSFQIIKSFFTDTDWNPFNEWQNWGNDS